jgi:hypothetical protein
MRIGIHFSSTGNHYYLPNCWYTWLVLSLLPIFFIIGVIIQYAKTSKGSDHRLGKKRFFVLLFQIKVKIIGYTPGFGGILP